MVFWIKKTIAPLLFPLPLMLALFALGLGLLWWTERQRAGRIVVTLGFVGLILFSVGPVSSLLMRPFERGQEPLVIPAAPDSVGWVVVLGGGVVDDPRLPANAKLSLSSLARVVEGVRVLGRYPQARLVVSGGVIFNTVSEARVMADVALMLGVDSTRIVLEDGSMDTKDQAMNIRPLVRDDPFVLVTSASHMPRAVALFRKQALDPIAAPTDFALKEGTYGFRITHLFPNAGDLKVSSQAWYELLGNLWVRLSGQV